LAKNSGIALSAARDEVIANSGIKKEDWAALFPKKHFSFLILSLLHPFYR
jgi:hypothetical protein